MKKITLLIALVLLSLQSNAQLFTQNFDTSLGWTILHPTGTSTLAGWSRVTTGTYPTCTPFAGAGMARFNSYNVPAGNVYSLTSPAITFAGANYRVKFKMYRDNGYPTDLDNIKFYLNSVASSVGGTLLGTVHRSTEVLPTEATSGWYTYYFDLAPGLTGVNYLSLKATSAYGNNMFIDEISIVDTPLNDAAMNLVNFAPVIATIGNNVVSGSIKNVGGNDINSLDINWQVDSGTIYTQSMTGLAITAGQAYNFTLTDQWNATPGLHSLKVWLSNTNGNDTDLTNNEIIKSIYVVNEIFPKTVVYEEGTGTWCQWCPRGAVGLKDMLHNHDDGTFLGIAVHNGDPMVLAAYNAGLASYISGYPSGTLNRNQGEIDPGLSSIEPAYQAELSKVPLGKVSVPDVIWDPTTRMITFNAIAKFALDLNTANYNLAAIIIENGVTGTTSTYAQVNAYSGGAAGNLIDWEGNNWTTYSNPVPASQMVYNHVGRALLGGYTGFVNSIPAVVNYNTPYTYAFSHTLPTTQNVNNIEVVGILIDNATGKIVNANNFDLGRKLETLTLANFSKNKVSIYPNPSNGIVGIHTIEAVTLNILDIMGKVVFSIKNITNDSNINLSSLQKGMYLVKVTGENTNHTEKLILN
jgi:hypothetical protein